MAIDFPNSPTNGQVFTSGTKTWTYNSADNKWVLSTSATSTAQYVTLASDGTLTNERILTAGTGITVTDGGAGGNVTVATSAILPTLVDAKGELIVGTADNTVARLGNSTNNGDMLVVDTSTSTGLRWQGQANAGRNAIINGGFDVWQRGTSFSNPANLSYLADRFFLQFDGSGATRTISRQTFTPGSAPVSGYEAPYFFRFNQSIAGSSATYTALYQSVEDVRTFAGRTVTVSFYAKADSARDVTLVVDQRFGTGGSTPYNVGSSTFTLSTSWARYSWTFTMSSISGKTIGTDSHLWLVFSLPVNTTYTIDFWGVQLEQGSVATRFEELPYAETLRKCQRYYFRFSTSGASAPYSMFGFTTSATESIIHTKFPVTMRTAPTALEQTGTASHYRIYSPATSANCSAVPAFNNATAESAITACTLASGQTAGQGCVLTNGTGGAASYLGWSAEL